ncbi:GDSL-like Lipase/Acylhydrolase [Colletotrichum sublineola]|nr:GDSL-like Lipase/Acylhydrolase [Colletotrichum sublineola]
MAKPYPQIVLLGDSLIQGCCQTSDGFSFQAELQCFVMRRFDVVNRGFNGWNTANAVKYLTEMFPPPSESGPRLKCLVVLLGANDAVRPMETTVQHVPLSDYKKNLVKIVTHSNITGHNPRILLVTPPPIDEIRVTELDLAAGHPKSQRTSKISAEYTQAARDVAAEVPGVVLVDLWQALMDRAVSMTPGYEAGGPLLGTPELGERGGLADLLPDGLHMSGEAYRVFYTTLLAQLGDWCEDTVFPDWRAVNPPE